MTAIIEARFRAAEFWRNLWAVNPEHGTTLEDMLNEGYWAHVATKLRPWDKIEVRAEDGSFYAELLVREAGRTWAKVFPITYVKMAADESKEETVDSNYKIAWKGPQRKWEAIRIKDGSVLKSGLLDKSDAIKYVAEHLKAFAA